MMKKLFALLLALPLVAAAADLPDGNELMQKVYDRDEGITQISQINFTLTDKRGKVREQQPKAYRRWYDNEKRQVIFYQEPTNVRGTGFLTYDYDDADRDDDQWLYLPSLGRTTRISGADKSGAFMGTDLSYADMTRRDTDAYSYTLVDADAKVGDEAAWQIEARPSTDKEKSETGYLKSHLWISKDKLVPLQSKAWVSEGKRLKYTQFKDIRKVDGLWIAHQLLVRTVRNGDVESTSTLVFRSLAFNQEGVVAEDFSERRLEKGL